MKYAIARAGGDYYDGAAFGADLDGAALYDSRGEVYQKIAAIYFFEYTAAPQPVVSAAAPIGIIPVRMVAREAVSE